MKNKQFGKDAGFDFTYSHSDVTMRVYDLRIKNRLTQEALGAALGKDRSYVGQVESGKRHYREEVLADLALLFDVSTDYLIFGRDRSAERAKTALKGISQEINSVIDSL